MSFLGNTFDDAVSLRYHTHPTALLQLLDHHARRDKKHKITIGTLMGYVSTSNVNDGFNNDNSSSSIHEKAVHVTHSLPLAPSAAANAPVDQRYDWEAHITAIKMHRRVYPREQVLGWYTTSAAIGDAETEIHDYFVDRMSEHLTSSDELVVVTVDASLKQQQQQQEEEGKGQNRIPIKAYSTRVLQLNDIPLGWEWIELLDGVEFVSHSVTSWEQLAVRAYTPLSNGNGTDTKQPLLLRENVLVELQTNLARLMHLIDALQTQYVQVQEQQQQEVEMKHAHIGRTLSYVLQQVGPLLDSGKFDQAFNHTLQDLMMCIYLGNLARSQLQMTERLLATPNAPAVQQERTTAPPASK